MARYDQSFLIYYKLQQAPSDSNLFVHLFNQCHHYRGLCPLKSVVLEEAQKRQSLCQKIVLSNAVNWKIVFLTSIQYKHCLLSWLRIQVDKQLSQNSCKSIKLQIPGTCSPPACKTVLTAQLHHLKNKNGHWGTLKWPTGSVMGCNLRFLGTPINFA